MNIIHVTPRICFDLDSVRLIQLVDRSRDDECLRLYIADVEEPFVFYNNDAILIYETIMKLPFPKV